MAAPDPNLMRVFKALLGPPTRRYWVRNARTQRVLGSVWAAEEDEAMGKAQVKYGIAQYQADGFTLTKGE